MANESLIEKMENIPMSIWIALPWILTVIMILAPLGLPVAVTPEVRDAFEAVTSVPEDGNVIVLCHYSLGTLVGWGPQETAVIKHMLKRHLNLFFVSFGGQTTIALQKFFDYWGVYTVYGYKYGEDVVVTPFVPGEEAAFAAISEDIWNTVSVDWNDTPFSDLPMMANLRNGGDFDLAFDTGGGGEQAHYVVRQFYVPWGIPIVRTSSAADVPLFIAYYQAGQIKGFLAAGATGAAQYEVLAGMPGLGATYSDSISIQTFALVAVFILGNIVDLLKRSSREQRRIS